MINNLIKFYITDNDYFSLSSESKNKKMKALNFKSIFFSLAIALGIMTTSCVGDDDWGLPNLGDGVPADIDGTVVPLDEIVNRISNNGGELEVLRFEEDLFTSGYVVSSDEAGNFFREIWIQDEPENPTTALRISVNVSPLFGTFPIGQKIFLRMDGLTIGYSRGANPTVGISDGSNIGRIPALQAERIMIRDNVRATIVPREVQAGNLQPSMVGQMIKLTNMQFPLASIENGVTFAAEPNDQFDAERTLESCDSNATIQVATSTFADFRGTRVPTGSGDIVGIPFFAFGSSTDFIFKINSTEDIDFDPEVRCDPEPEPEPEPICEGPSGGNDVIFSEDFEGITNIGQLQGWINVNTTGGTLTWGTGTFSGNRYAQISGFNTSQTYDVWLVTPEINLSGSSMEEFRVDIEAAFDNGKGLSILVTDNYSGDVTTTEWQEMENIEVPVGPSSGFGALQPAGAENISCLETVRIAFRYQGADPGVTTRYHIDNVRIVGQN